MSAAIRTPYPGLRAYETSESDLFFGREDCVDEMLSKLEQTRFLAVLGNSGSGKSSLVRTGLLDALELGFLSTASHDWKVADMHPGGRPLKNLAISLLQADGAPFDQVDIDLMRGQIARGPRSLMQWCDEGNLGEGQSLLLLVDQFEELFRYQDYAGREEAEAFVALLLESARSDPRIHVVLTMRSEYLGACALMPGLAEQINAGLYLTPRMSRAECGEAIEGPAKVLGFEVEPRLVNHILNDMATFAPWEGEDQDSSLVQLARRADQLPLMQHALNRLWEAGRKARPDAPVLRFEDYEGVGGLRGAVNDHAEEVLTGLSDEGRKSVSTVFKALMSGSNISDAVRAPKPFGDLVKLVGDEGRTREVVDAFRAPGCNFLRPPLDVRLDESSIIDLGHESLIRQWGRLKQWLDEEARANTQWSRLAIAQGAEAEGAGELLDGLELDIAREWWDEANPSRTWAKDKGGNFDSIAAFLKRSVEADEARLQEEVLESKRKTRNLRYRAAAYLVAAVVACGSALYSFQQGSVARTALAAVEVQAKAAEEARDIANTARQEAIVDRIAAQSAEQSAIEAQAKAERAFDFAADTLGSNVLDAAESLSAAVGVSDDVVDRFLDGAESDIEDLMSEVSEDNAALIATNVRLLSLRASRAGGRNDMQRMDELISQSWEEITPLFDGEPDDVPSVAVDAYLTVLRQKASRAYSMSDAELELQLKEESRTFFERYQQFLGDRERKSWDLSLYADLSISNNRLGRVEPARQNSRLCLEYDVDETDSNFQRLKVRCSAAALYAHSNDDILPEGLEEVIDESLSLTSESERQLSYWDDWFYIKNDLARRASNASDFTKASEITRGSIEAMDKLIWREPENADLRRRRNSLYHGQIYYLDQLGDKAGTYETALRAHENLTEMGDSWRNSVVTTISVSDVLSNISAAANDLEGYASNPSAVKFDLRVKTDQIEALAHLRSLSPESLCSGCALEAHGYIGKVYEDLYALGEYDEVEGHFALYEALSTTVETILDSEPDAPQSHAAAQRALFWLTESLPGAEDLALMEERDNRTKLNWLRRSAVAQEAYVERYPFAGTIRRELSDNHAMQARLLFDFGEPSQSRDSLELAVSLGGLEAHNLMHEWLFSGNGPLERDLERAEDVVEILQSREWSVKSESVTMIKHWDAETEGSSIYLFYYDEPVGSSRSAMRNAIREMVELRGMLIPDTELERLYALEEAAISAGKTLAEHLSDQPLPMAGADFNWASTEQALLLLTDATDARDFTRGKEILSQVWDYDAEGPKRFEEILDIYFANEKGAGYVLRLTFAKEVAEGLWFDGARTEALHVLDALLERRQALPVADQADLLYRRGQYHSWNGDWELSQADFLNALALDPEHPTYLNAAGYNYTEEQATLTAAISLLERAVIHGRQPKYEQKLHLYLDSLGWAYVEVGRLDEGLNLIKEAYSTGGQENAEIVFHLGETYRRMGQNGSAVRTFRSALDLYPSFDLKRKIEDQLELAEASLSR